MQNKEEIKKRFAKIDELGQKIFFDVIEPGPTAIDPRISELWEEYIQARKDLNVLLPEGSRTVAIVITSARLFFNEKGFVTGYYHDLILAPEDFNVRMNQIVGSQREVTEIIIIE